jgi:hypothetical protein
MMTTDGFTQADALRRSPMQNGISLVRLNGKIRNFAQFDSRLKTKNAKVAILPVSNAKVSRNSSENFSEYSC